MSTVALCIHWPVLLVRAEFVGMKAGSIGRERRGCGKVEVVLLVNQIDAHRASVLLEVLLRDGVLAREGLQVLLEVVIGFGPGVALWVIHRDCR